MSCRRGCGRQKLPCRYRALHQMLSQAEDRAFGSFEMDLSAALLIRSHTRGKGHLMSTLTSARAERLSCQWEIIRGKGSHPDGWRQREDTSLVLIGNGGLSSGRSSTNLT